jgi:hypothetical protein
VPPLLQDLAFPEPTLIWGLISRGLGLTFLLSFWSLSQQVLPIAGSRGITPIAHSLSAIARDFPSWRRFFYFPSLLWLSRSDAMLVALPRLGMLAAASLIVGGPHAPLAFACCYLVYLSLDRAFTLVYPWDCMLFEAGFWGMFLPATALLPQLGTLAAPSPLIAWVYRLLALRVIWGFGKHKFLGSKPQDSGFLKGFLINQPLPTPLGLLSQRMPMRLLELGLLSMFIVELPLPLAALFPGLWSSLAAISLIALMGMIWLTGNYGYFNLAMSVVTLSWLDNTTASALSLEHFTHLSHAAPAQLFLVFLVCTHTQLSLVTFPWDTFCAQTWTHWPLWQRAPRWLTLPVTLTRLLHPLRWLHAYGVFPPHSVAPGRLMPVLEATWDDRTWHTLHFRYAPTIENAKASYCAPHHERFDQSVVYEGLGLNESSMFRGIVGRWDPYGYGGVPAARMLMQRILQGDVPGDRFYDRSLERELGKPLAVRVRSYFFGTASDADFARGKHFERTLAGPHFAPLYRRTRSSSTTTTASGCGARSSAG